MKPPDLRDQLRYAYDPQIRGLHHLMARRVRTILMVSNPYESFSLSRDSSTKVLACLPYAWRLEGFP